MEYIKYQLHAYEDTISYIISIFIYIINYVFHTVQIKQFKEQQNEDNLGSNKITIYF